MKLFLTLCILASAAGFIAQAEPVDEVQVTIVPKKGAKFDAQAIYQKDEEILQGIFGTAGDNEVKDLALLPSNEIIVTGHLGNASQLPASVPRGAVKGLAGGGNAFIAIFDSTFRKLERILFFPPDVTNLQSVRVGGHGAVYACGAAGQNAFVAKLDPTLAQLAWRTNVPGSNVSSMVVMPDNSVVVMPVGAGPFLFRIKPDGSGTMPWGTAPSFRYDRANPQIQQKYWVDLGYEGKGFHEQGFLKGGVSELGLTSDGNLALCTSNSIRLPGGGPDFDPMLIKFSTAGDVLWAKNLLQGIPAEPDQKNPHLYVDPFSGDLILTMTQHGSFERGHNLIVTPGCYLTTDNWFTGDIFVGWIGRIDSATGETKAATMYFPDLRKPPEAGKSFANTLFPDVARTDKAGNIYVAGASAYKLATTKHAYQPEPIGGGAAFVTVFNPNLSKIIYANLISAQGYGTRARQLLVTTLGPLVATDIIPPKSPPAHLVTTNVDKTNFLKDNGNGGLDVMFSLLPSKSWFQDWAE